MSRPVRQGPDSDPGPDPDFDPETEANGISSEAPKAPRGCAPDPETPPALVLNGANPQFIEVGSPYVELGATASDIGDPTVNAGSIVIDSSAFDAVEYG